MKTVKPLSLRGPSRVPKSQFKNQCPRETYAYLYNHIHDSTAWNSQKEKTTQMPINKRMN